MATFDTSNQSFRRIMGNGVQYSVPRFQRDYAWSEEQWEDLWNDLTDPDRDAQHYMGYLVLQQGESPRHFSIIDGQQRLTTISIIIIAVLRRLKGLIDAGREPESNAKRLEALMGSFIGAVNPVSLQVNPKLSLNRNNDRYFDRFVCRLADMPLTHVNRSSRLLRDAVLFFEARLTQPTGEELAQFVETMIDALLFTTIEVGNDLNAYRVLETLNARGVQLSVPDLIKNFLFSMIDRADELHEAELDELETSWAEITSSLGKNEFPRFVRAEWNSRNVSASKFSLFKRIKREVVDRGSAHAYLNRLRSSVDVYAAIQEPTSELWNEPGFEGAPSYLEALKLFRIRQPDPLLLAAFSRFEPAEWTKVLGYIVVVSIRFKVIGRRPGNEQEPIYHRLAQEVSSGHLRSLRSMKVGLQSMHPTDDEFQADFNAFKLPTERSQKQARWLLAELERQSNPDLALASDELTLEHVLPKNPGEGWLDEFTGGSWRDFVPALGNMTLLAAGGNRDLGNAPFSRKREVFRTSSLSITRKAAEFEQWGPAAIRARQAWLGELACQRWKIQFD
ncbi:hypothetical protein Poly30_38580 [Planctomycetes bacterium Poly30]|uniref:DUF262 domain-containing protein n=1 Tax=Saltatorellus ferox TaxID=2528018 RepID=A0A518EW63_9BACT|nr:hypothetical protein Poly30_38580 [Planctomycetes bacterium Poly30]